jgi:hypothetical protein
MQRYMSAEVRAHKKQNEALNSAPSRHNTAFGLPTKAP